jgi:anthranilate phosphoribosyltransferase
MRGIDDCGLTIDDYCRNAAGAQEHDRCEGDAIVNRESSIVNSAMTDSPSTASPPEFDQPSRSGELTAALRLLLAGRTLSADQMASAFEAMMTGQVHHAEVAALLALLATRTPTSDEILGAARVMRAHVDRVPTRLAAEQIVDTAGTGGAPKTFNVSTAAALIAAAALMQFSRPGAGRAASAARAIAKHGNRSRTGRGSAEVLEKLGVNVHADRATQARCLDEAGICFCFAIHHHPATKHVMPVRQALGFATMFNLLGPLTNPAGARRQVMGVYDRRLLQPTAEALRDLGAIRAMVVHSNDGLDELSISASTNIFHVRDGQVTEEVLSPKQVGLNIAPMESVIARDLDHAAAMIQAVIEGHEMGPPRDMAVLNAAATLVVADRAGSFEEGTALAAKAIDTGSAAATLKRLIELSRRAG